MIRSAIVLAAVLAAGATVAPATAAEQACKVNYKQEGSFFAGRRFSTWDVVVDVAPAVAFKRIYTEGVKSGLTVASSDKEMGIISFQQLNAGVTSSGTQVNVPWNVTIEAEGKGSKITVSKTTPGGYSTSQDFQQTSMCAVIDAARTK